MRDDETRTLVEQCLHAFPAAQLPRLTPDMIERARATQLTSLWAGCGAVYQIDIETASAKSHHTLTIVAKRVDMPERCNSIGDQRKKKSYDHEAAFYSKGHAQRLIAAGAMVPFPLHVEPASRGANVTIVMTHLDGRPSHAGGDEAFVKWLAILHATYWGERADAACGEGGLQPQGTYWHLDTRPEEHARMGTSGWLGRLKLAARAIDLRLKADAMQTCCHGDAKGANILYATRDDGTAEPLVHDFQYCGKACAAKDLAYLFNVSRADEPRLLGVYHEELSRLLLAQGDAPPRMEALRTSLELALADWRRFSEIGLGGWGDASANRRVIALLDRLDGGSKLADEQAYIDVVAREFPL